MSADETFLARWSRRKRDTAYGEEASPAGAAHGETPADVAPAAADPVRAAAPEEAGDPARAAAPASGASVDETATLPAIDTLRPESDFTAFMKTGVDPSTRASALRRLFADPHFNRMDGLDIYIDDYGKPDPIPLAMLKMMNQARSLGLFDDDEKRADEPARVTGVPADPDPRTSAPRDAAGAEPPDAANPGQPVSAGASVVRSPGPLPAGPEASSPESAGPIPEGSDRA